MNNKMRTLTPPHPFRQRVIDPEFYLANVKEFEVIIPEILRLAQNFENGQSSIAVAWAEQIVMLQKKNLVPNFSEDLITAAQIGVAVSLYEEQQNYILENQTSYIIHSMLAIFASDESKEIAFLRTLLIDGAYYLRRSRVSPEALGESVIRSL